DGGRCRGIAFAAALGPLTKQEPACLVDSRLEWLPGWENPVAVASGKRPRTWQCRGPTTDHGLRAWVRRANGATARIRSSLIPGGERQGGPRTHEGTGPGPSRRSPPQALAPGFTTRPRPACTNLRNPPENSVTSRHGLMPLGLTARNSRKN